jgi:hypothetical protein
VARRELVELGEDDLLDLHPLRYRLDHEVDVPEAGVAGRALDAPEHLGELRVCLLLRQLAALDELGHLAARNVARLVDPCLHERVVDVLQHDRNARDGDRLGDLAAHRPGADDSGSEHEHSSGNLLCWLATGDTSVLQRPGRCAPLGGSPG